MTEIKPEIAEMVERMRKLAPEHQEKLQSLCFELMDCVGENPTADAVIILREGYSMRVLALNAAPQDILDMMTFANQLVDKSVIGEKPQFIN